MGVPKVLCLALAWGHSTPQPGAEPKLQINRKWVEQGAIFSWLPSQCVEDGRVNPEHRSVSSLDSDLSWMTL